ncbi:hypothetical protein AGMMS50284_6330 [Clostridia bacterium]|nr:hypothetical protein AGMMS50284_6330 [Clostridia bacterium]
MSAEINGRKTISTLHRKVWEIEQRKATVANKIIQFGKATIPKFQYPSGDMVVMVGSWIDKYPNLPTAILIEFDLPEDTTFMVGEH